MTPYGFWNQIYQYSEGRGAFTQMVARYLRDNTLYLLPIKAKSFKLLESAGVVDTDLVGWPQEFIIDYGLPEGFFKVGHPWSYTVTANSPNDNTPVDHRFYDPVYTGTDGRMTPRPDIEHVYEDTVRYDVSEFGVRFAMNLYDRVRLGPEKWNRRMKDMMKRRIDAYALQLNQMIWDYRKTAYLVDSSKTQYTNYNNPQFNRYDTLGSLPFFLNGLICRFGILGPADRPTNASTIANSKIVALTFHDGNFARVPDKVRVGDNTYIHWSTMPVFFHTDLYKVDNSGNRQLLTVADLAANGLYDDGSYYRRHVVGTHERGVKNLTPEQLFNGPGFSNLNPADHLSGIYWQLFTPALLSPHWNLSYSSNLTHITPGDPRRVMEVYRRTKMPAVYASRVSLTIPYYNDTSPNPGTNLIGTTNYTIYPIYGYDNPIIADVSGPGGTTLGWTLYGVDTRAPITATALETVYYAISENQNGTAPRLLIMRPEIHTSLNVMSIATPTYWKDATSGKVHNTQFGGEFSRYKDAVVMHDLVCPRGVVFIGTLNRNTIQFSFDNKNFDVEYIPMPAAVQYFQGFFAMKMMLINPQSWGMVWGVREAVPNGFITG